MNEHPQAMVRLEGIVKTSGAAIAPCTRWRACR